MREVKSLPQAVEPSLCGRPISPGWVCTISAAFPLKICSHKEPQTLPFQKWGISPFKSCLCPLPQHKAHPAAPISDPTCTPTNKLSQVIQPGASCLSFGVVSSSGPESQVFSKWINMLLILSVYFFCSDIYLCHAKWKYFTRGELTDSKISSSIAFSEHPFKSGFK